MADTKIRIQKATRMLREDHRKVKKLFASYEKLKENDEGRKEDLYESIKKELRIHTQIEEEIFYPAVESAPESQARKLILEAREEHKIVKTLLAELDAIESDDTEGDAKMKVLKDSVLHHAEEEEEQIFPIFESLDREEKSRIAERLSERKQELEAEEPEISGDAGEMG
jgi:hemerythrin superfamily protein